MRHYTKGIVTIAAMVLLIASTMWFSRPEREGADKKAVPVEIAPIKTGSPQRRDFTLSCQWLGRVESKQVIKVAALEAGRVVSIGAQDAEIAKKGRALFRLGGTVVESRLKTLQLRLASLKERAALTDKIVQIKQEAVTEKMAKAEELIAAENDAAQLQDELAGTRQELITFQDAICIRSPETGIFTNRQVSAGQDVEKGAYLADIVSPADVRIVATLFPPEGMPLEGKIVALEGKMATIDGAHAKVITGTIVKVLPEHTTEGARIVWIEGDAINQQMKPGEMASGKIALLVREKVLAVPVDAIVRDEEEHPFVFLKVTDGYREQTKVIDGYREQTKVTDGYRKQAVEIGLTSQGWSEVVLGVPEDAQVVVQGAYELFYRDFSKIYKVAD